MSYQMVRFYTKDSDKSMTQGVNSGVVKARDDLLIMLFHWGSVGNVRNAEGIQNRPQRLVSSVANNVISKRSK